LLKVEGMTKEIADVLTKSGINSAEELAQVAVEELKEIGISEEQAQALITAAQQFMTLPEDVDQKTETVGEGTTER